MLANRSRPHCTKKLGYFEFKIISIKFKIFKEYLCGRMEKRVGVTSYCDENLNNLIPTLRAIVATALFVAISHVIKFEV